MHSTRSRTKSIQEDEILNATIPKLFLEEKGVDLGDWLQDKSNQTKISNKRILYVVKANLDENVYKFGIGGLEGGNSAYGRLLQYVNYYGSTLANLPNDEVTKLTGKKQDNQCIGVKLYLIVGNEYSHNPYADGKFAASKNSLVARKEAYLKKLVKLRGDTLKGRGRERTSMTLNELIRNILEPFSKHIIQDEIDKYYIKQEQSSDKVEDHKQDVRSTPRKDAIKSEGYYQGQDEDKKATPKAKPKKRR